MGKKQIANEIRQLTYDCIKSIGVGHIGGSLSSVDILTALYYELMNINPAEPKMQGRDRLVVSKGHAGPAVYSTLAHKGYFEKSELLTLNRFGTHLPSHCDMNLTTGIDMTTGSLGQGFSCAVGCAVGSKIRRDNAVIYTIIGDGESQEGLIWEAAMFAAHKKLDNLIAFTDNNKMQIDGLTNDVCSLGDLKAKWTAFGFDTYEIDGHNIDEIVNTVNKAKSVKGKPHMIICNTVKGKGFKQFEDLGVDSHSTNVG
jgi:transketolase